MYRARRGLAAGIVVASAMSLAAGAAVAANPTTAQMVEGLKPSDATAPRRSAVELVPMAPMPPDPPPPRKIAHVKLPVPDKSENGCRSGQCSLSVMFRSGSAELTPEAEQVLSDLGKALNHPDLQGYRFRIEGHTDTVGTRDFNKTLSASRAETVAAFLQKRSGVAPARLETVGMGEDGLAVATPDQTSELQNRRVHVVTLGS